MSPEAERRLREGDITAREDRRRPRRSFLIAHAYEACFAAAGLLTSLQFIFDAETRDLTAVGSIGSTFAWCWTVLFLIGSVGILVGLFWPSDRVELAGLSCFAPACLVQAASVIEVRGVRGVYVALIFVAFFCGTAARIYLLLKLRRIITTSSQSRG